MAILTMAILTMVICLPWLYFYLLWQSTAGLTILRCAQPLIGGPYYALDPDSIGRGNAQLADMCLAAEVAPNP